MTQDYPAARQAQATGAEYRDRAMPVGPVGAPERAVEPAANLAANPAAQPPLQQAVQPPVPATLPAPPPVEPEPARGATRITETVVAKIAALAAGEVPGVHSLGRGPGHPAGFLRGGPGDEAVEGVSVEIADATVAIDLGLVTWYGQSITQVTEAVRRNVVGRVEGMTGLRVAEVDITVEDLHVGPAVGPAVGAAAGPAARATGP